MIAFPTIINETENGDPDGTNDDNTGDLILICVL